MERFHEEGDDFPDPEDFLSGKRKSNVFGLGRAEGDQRLTLGFPANQRAIHEN